jgi:hypothetical protein
LRRSAAEFSRKFLAFSNKSEDRGNDESDPAKSYFRKKCALKSKTPRSMFYRGALSYKRQCITFLSFVKENFQFFEKYFLFPRFQSLPACGFLAREEW